MMNAHIKKLILLKSFYTSYQISIMVLQSDNMTSVNLSLNVIKWWKTFIYTTRVNPNPRNKQ